MKETLRRLGVIALTLLPGCQDAVAPYPRGAVVFTPPSEYRTWWRQVETCSGKTKDFDAVTWYQIPGQYNFELEGGFLVEGVYNPARNSITLAGELRTDAKLVRHEQLHAIIVETGHPKEYFTDRCVQLVYNK